MQWEKAFKNHLEQLYGDFARFMDEDAHYEPPQVEFDEALLGAVADPHGIYLAQIKTENAERTKEEKELRRNWTPVYALMIAVIGVDIEDGIKELEGYAEAEQSRDPLQLLRLCRRSALGEGNADTPRDTARLAREAFHALRQLEGEENADYYERFKFVTHQMQSSNERMSYDAEGNEIQLPFLSDAEVADHFLYSLSLDHERFVADTVNDSGTGAAPMPENLSEMYTRLCSYKDTGGRAPSRGGRSVFAAISEDTMKSDSLKKTLAKKPKVKSKPDSKVPFQSPSVAKGKPKPIPRRITMSPAT